MNRIMRYRLAIAVLIMFDLLIGCVWYTKSEACASREHIATMKHELIWILQNMVDWEHLDSRPVQHYIALATAKTLATLDGKETLEHPFVVYCLLYRDTPDGHAKIMFEFLEEGFESAGIEISYQDGGGGKVARLPFPSGVFDSKEERRLLTTDAPLRAFPSRVNVTADGIEIEAAFRSQKTPSKVTLPLSILEDPAYFSVYTRRGDKSVPARLLLTQDMREYIQQTWLTP